MFEFHGWATILFTPENRERDDEDELQDAAVASVQAHVQQLGWARDPNLELGIRFVNGQAQLWTAGFKNRPGTIGEELFELFRSIARVAPGSYGLLYTRDDEDPAQANAFGVYVLARGSFSERPDHYLSPIVPVVEDPYSES